nr:hypothetical protein [Tanacetum cinerariifolium]
MALLSMRADTFWKKTGKKITIQGSDVAGFDKSKVECFNCHKMGHFARECRAPRIQDRGKRESYKQGPNVEEPSPKALKAIDGIGSDWSYMANEEKTMLFAVPPPPTQIYSPPKKDLTWTGLPEFVDDTVTDYRRPTPSIDASKCNKSEIQSSNFSVFEHGESTGSIMSKPMIKFMKEANYPRVIKINNTENARKSTMKYAKMYRNISKGHKVYVMQPPGFQDPEFPERVYKVEKAMYGLHQAPRAWYVYVDDIIFGSSNPQLCREFAALMHEKFQMSATGELTLFLGLQVLQKKDGIFLSQDKYVGDILKKFGYSDVRSANTPMDKENPWGKMDLCHLYVVKRIFSYLKGHPKLGLWYPKESPFDLVAYSDSDYGGATQDKKSTTGGCQFLGRRLISWQFKKQTIVATSTTEAEYVAAASGCTQVCWIQN